MSYTELLAEWSDLLERRATFREALGHYAGILTAWSRWPSHRIAPLRWSVDECRERWRRGVPLLAETTPGIPSDDLDDLLSPALEFLTAAGHDVGALRRFAEAWDDGAVEPAAFLPERGRLGSLTLEERFGLAQPCVGFLAYVTMRPILDAYFAECRPHFTEPVWSLGVCPFCGAPPGFADLVEDGRRRLSCHFCGAGWTFSRMQCPHCGSQNATDMVRYQAENKEEGYHLTACGACHGYLKELDRRVRWNAGSALIEDWGSPHFDLTAHRKGYWRPIPTLVEVTAPA